jgi:hypothetical protein
MVRDGFMDASITLIIETEGIGFPGLYAFQERNAASVLAAE